jgi:hypothetical protein
VFEAVEIDRNGDPIGSPVVLKDIWVDCKEGGLRVAALAQAHSGPIQTSFYLQYDIAPLTAPCLNAHAVTCALRRYLGRRALTSLSPRSHTHTLSLSLDLR